MNRIGKEYSKEIIESGIKADSIKEIVFSSGFAVTVITKEGKLSIGKRKLGLSDIREIFASLCEYSVHTYKNEINSGFITAEGGCRAGICGTAIYDGEKLLGIKDISALNIRIPHEIIGCAKEIFDEQMKGGILIIGPPCSGKTTMIRDMARILSEDKKVAVIDERMEIAGIYRGKPAFNLESCLVLNGFLKKDGISFASRSLAPDYIICDEFGGEDEINEALGAMKSGAVVIATMHAFDRKDFIGKPVFSSLIKSGIFSHFVFLDKNCRVTEIFSEEEICS